MENQIVVDFNTLLWISGQLQNAEIQLSDAMRRLSALTLNSQNGAMQPYSCSVMFKTVGSRFSGYTVADSIQGCRRAMGQLGDRLDHLSLAVRASAASFDQAERDVQACMMKTTTGEETPASGWDWEQTVIRWPLIWELVSSVGVIGPTVSVFGSLVTEDGIGKKIVESGKYGAKTIEEISELVGIDKLTWKHFLGFRKVTGSAKWSTQLRDDLLAFQVGKAKPLNENVKAVAKWTGAALTIVSNGIDNFAENENKGRALAETVGESTVELVEDFALTTFFTSLGVAVGAPVVVVGATVVLAKWGIDALSEHFTGEDLAESLSDLVLNGLEHVGNAFRCIGETVSGWWNALWNPPLHDGGGFR